MSPLEELGAVARIALLRLVFLQPDRGRLPVAMRWRHSRIVDRGIPVRREISQSLRSCLKTRLRS
jgi:hypothetical protein